MKRYYSRKVRPKDIIKCFEINYSKARYAELNEDEHQYLENTLLLIVEGKRNIITAEQELGLWDKITMLKSLAFNETILFSVLNYPESIRALSLYAIYKRIPTQSKQYQEEYDNIMAPILKMYNGSTFIQAYKMKNPRVAARTSETKVILPNMKEVMDEGLELVRLEAIDMPYKQLSQYLDEEIFSGKLSLFTWTNINNKIRCFCSNIDKVRQALAHYSDNISNMMEKAGFEDLTLPSQEMALSILARDGDDAMARYIAREVTLNADLLY